MQRMAQASDRLLKSKFVNKGTRYQTFAKISRWTIYVIVVTKHRTAIFSCSMLIQQQRFKSVLIIMKFLSGVLEVLDGSYFWQC